MMAEGWDGKSIRQHVENADAAAAEAFEMASAAYDEIEEFKARLGEMEERFDQALRKCEALEGPDRGRRNG